MTTRSSIACSLTVVLLAASASAQDSGAPQVAEVPSTSAAADPSAERATAEDPAVLAKYREVVDKAIVEFDAGRFAEARSYFQRAHDLLPSARTLRTLGMTAYELRLYPHALVELRAALADTRRPLDAEQRAHVEALIAESRAFVGERELHLSPAELTLVVDGNPTKLADKSVLVLGVGEHQVLARSPGHRDQFITLTILGGTSEPLPISLTPLTPAEPRAALDAAPVGPAQAARTDDARSRLVIVRWTSIGVGAASVVTASVFGGLAIARKRTLESDKNCPDEFCPPEYDDERRELRHFANASTGMFITGAALLATGAGVWLLERRAQASGRQVAVSAGPASLRVAGRF